MPAPDLHHENERLTSFLMAIYNHGTTTWPDSSCGSGQPAGQMITSEAHIEVIQHLCSAAFTGKTLTEAADQWEKIMPGTTRLDAAPAAPRRRGRDGRPV